MRRSLPRALAAALGAAGVATACASATARSTSPPPSAAPAAASAAAHEHGSGAAVRATVNAADVHFMSGMIPHHAQAVLIAGWAPSHGASPEVQRLCERIVVAQRDEIQLMQNWLREKGQPVPEATSMRMRMNMGGMVHDMLMPGMLTDEQLKALDASRGREFDRLFLQAMIRHHQGAISMVDDLEAADGSRQDETVFRFSQDVYADQTTEIRVMQQMLAAIK
jgi:uncharacterized protein (DUF305 family)